MVIGCMGSIGLIACIGRVGYTGLIGCIGFRVHELLPNS